MVAARQRCGGVFTSVGWSAEAGKGLASFTRVWRSLGWGKLMLVMGGSVASAAHQLKVAAMAVTSAENKGGAPLWLAREAEELKGTVQLAGELSEGKSEV